jgi:acetyl esterase
LSGEGGDTAPTRREGRPLERIPLGLRIGCRVFSLVPGSSIAKMSREQVERLHASTEPPGRLVLLLIDRSVGTVRPGVAAVDRTIAGPAGELPIRVYAPARPADAPRPVVVHFHGGGWVLGDLRGGDWMCSTVARDVDAVVVSVGYRLAPEHPFPAAPDDCLAAVTWARANAASLGADPDRLGVMGDSAGGNLAAVVALLARDAGGPPIAHQALLYPVTDGSMSWDSYRTFRDAPILTAADMEAYLRYYLPSGADPLDPRVSPLRAADHAGLPPAIVVVAGHDPLHDEGVAYADALRRAGVPTTFAEYPAMPHGFLTVPGFARDAPAAMAAVTAAQRATLRG